MSATTLLERLLYKLAPGQSLDEDEYVQALRDECRIVIIAAACIERGTALSLDDAERLALAGIRLRDAVEAMHIYERH